MQCVRQFARCTGPLRGPGRQSRKDVESNADLETPAKMAKAKAKAKMTKVARVRASGPRTSEELRQDGMGGRPPGFTYFNGATPWGLLKNPLLTS